MNRLEFQSLAAERLDDAGALLKAGRYGCAYYISGYAIECALKARIAKKTKQDELPPKEAAKFYVSRHPEIAGHRRSWVGVPAGSRAGSGFQSELGSCERLD
jgi:hypothetical protein